jgi:hypothetical protein
MSFHRFALAAGADAVANWHAHFLRNLIVGGSVDDEIFEPDLVAFYEILLSAQLTRRWPTDDELPAVSGHSGPCSRRRVGVPSLPTLDTYCDFRLSRAFQFEDGNAKKPRRPSDLMFVFEAQWLALFPFELFSLRGVYRAIAGLTWIWPSIIRS